MSLYNTFYNIPEIISPEEFEEQEKDEIAKCDHCLEPTVCFVIHKGYILCDDCITNQEGESLDQLVENIRRYSKPSMVQQMQNIKNLSELILNPS